jgi:hypothetical protein
MYNFIKAIKILKEKNREKPISGDSVLRSQGRKVHKGCVGNYAYSEIIMANNLQYNFKANIIVKVYNSQSICVVLHLVIYLHF